MKKFLCVILAAVSAMFCFACADSDDESVWIGRDCQFCQCYALYLIDYDGSYQGIGGHGLKNPTDIKSELVIMSHPSELILNVDSDYKIVPGVLMVVGDVHAPKPIIKIIESVSKEYFLDFEYDESKLEISENFGEEFNYYSIKCLEECETSLDITLMHHYESPDGIVYSGEVSEFNYHYTIKGV